MYFVKRKRTGCIFILLLCLLLLLSACGNRDSIANSNVSQEVSDNNENDDLAPVEPQEEDDHNENDADMQDTSPEDDDNDIDVVTPEAPIEVSPEVSPDAVGEEAFIDVRIIDEVDLDSYSSFDEFVEFDEEGYQRIVFTTSAVVTDFRFIEVGYNSDGPTIEFFESSVLYSIDELLPEKPLVVTWMEWGLIPHRGISYIDENSTRKFFSINLSGYDGSLLLVEFVNSPPSGSNNTGESVSDEIIEIKVSTAEEFVTALGSNRRILLEAGVYDLTSLSHIYIGNPYGEAIYYGEVFDGLQLVLSGVHNLSIIGIGDEHSELVVEPRYANVMCFGDCSNISIANIKAGHTDKDGYCSGAVFAFVDSTNINIDDTLMYGCGAYGLLLSGVKDMSVFNSTIYECTYGIMCLIDKNLDILFEDCEFRDNTGYSMVEIWRGPSRITFDSCTFRNNYCSPVINGGNELYPMFSVSESENVASVAVKNSLFVDNVASMLVKQGDVKIDASNTFENNSFDKRD